MSSVQNLSISFAEIVKDRDSSVRVTGDGLLNAVDLAMVMTGKNCNHSNEILRDINQSLFNNEKFVIRSRTRYLSFRNAIELILVLPGKIAKETRSRFASIIERYMAGDRSLVKEVEANAQSDAPIAQMARASLAAERASEPVVDSHVLMHKRKLEELEIENMQLDLTIKRRGAELEYAEKITTNYRALCQDTSMDSRAALILKDFYLNMIILPPVAAPNRLTDGTEQQPAPPPVSSRPISLSQVATELGLKIPTGELISLGGKLRKEYESKHGHPPGKHDQLCSGRMTKVNSYCESDRPLVEEVLREWSPAQ